MRIWATSDLHLSFANPKPMLELSSKWLGHPELIPPNWNNVVSKDDIVLIAGDISWATHFEDAIPDLKFINQLNGTKIIIKGNHDFWWQGKQKLENFTKNMSIIPLRNNCVQINNISTVGTNIGIVGTRGYNFEYHKEVNVWEISSKHLNRELNRLQLSIEDSKEKDIDMLIAMIHYPPFARVNGGESPITKILEENNIKICVYGHIHTIKKHKPPFQGWMNGIRYYYVSCEQYEFYPVLIYEE